MERINRKQFVSRLIALGAASGAAAPFFGAALADDLLHARELHGVIDLDEAGLDALAVPDTHRDLCHGASVGHASRQAQETPGQVLGRAIDRMRERKLVRKSSARP